jgi:hypothetical protein
MIPRTAEELRDRFTYCQPCCVEDTPDAHTVWIKIDNQSFCIDGYQDTKDDAEWMRLMLGKAFRTLLDLSGKDGKASTESLNP